MVVVSQLLLKLSVRINLLSAKKSRSIVFFPIRTTCPWIAATTNTVSSEGIVRLPVLNLFSSSAQDATEVLELATGARQLDTAITISTDTFPRKLMPNTGICLLIAG